MNEKWKDIAGYEGVYKVSNLGNVYSSNCRRNLKGGYTIDGYKFVGLYKNGIKNVKFVHRLVGEAFIDNPRSLPVINHKDENPKNNHVNNLEWCDYRYNATYNDAHKKRGDKLGNHVYAYNRKGDIIEEYKSIRDAERTTGISSGSISECCTKKRCAANNIVWSYYKLSIDEVKERFKQYDKNRTISQNIGNVKSKKVNQYDLNGKFIQSFSSAQEAGRQLGFSQSLISSVCRGEHKHTHGYMFKYT